MRGLTSCVGAFALLVLAAGGCQHAAPHDEAEQIVMRSVESSTATAEEQSVAVVETPENVARMFWVAMLQHDETALRRLTIPADGLEILWEPDPILAARGVRERPTSLWFLLAQAFMPYRRAAVGETFLFGKLPVTFTHRHINDGSIVLIAPAQPMPTFVVRVNGRWRVDAGPLLAARRKAFELRVLEQESAPPTS